MINVKLIVLFVTFTYEACRGSYCNICPNHTLCRFPTPGPSSSCNGYNESTLTNADIATIVNRINEKRNFIALGLSRTLPQAANMKKIVWSVELAFFAQRWVDQCDHHVRPDSEDQCRDLVGTRVGQIIGSVIGPTSQLNMKSFVDIWFMQILEYKGNVSYYNKSQDAKTNYFTQLIWAETDKVGCGFAKFFVTNINQVVSRLVCNFAPKGNVDGKTVYAIGFSATQCPDYTTQDDKFPGLCSHQRQKIKLSSKSPRVSSLLRILNLSNNSAKQDIDPNDLNHVKFHTTHNIRNPRIRHVIPYINNSYAGLPYDQQQMMLWNDFLNNTKNHGFRRFQQEERGHSRMYHGHEHRDNNILQHKLTTEPNFRKFDFTSVFLNTFPSSNFRKDMQHHQCTRRFSPTNNECIPNSVNACCSNMCTRGNKLREPCSTTTCKQNIFPPELCSCDRQHSTCPTTTQCCQTVCQCTSDNYPSRCPNIARSREVKTINETQKSEDLHYYDLFPNIAVRSGDIFSESATNKDVFPVTKEPGPLRYTLANQYSKSNIIFNKRTSYQQNNKQVNNEQDHPKYIEEDHDYLYGSFDSSERQRRKSEDQLTFKPFWQIDEYNHKLPTQLKSLRFTTLPNKKSRRTMKSTIKTITEPITVKLKDIGSHNDHAEHITEKYLSFDELMHLRKFNDEYNARRSSANKATTKTLTKATTTGQKLTSPAIYTTDTPFMRKKHCTRVVTCTWTMATITGSDGSILNNPGGGSRTPPGYVEGCTRTSTCTRIHMNRNKISTVSTENPDIEHAEDDEDYCERRSLNVKRHIANDNEKPIHKITVKPPTTRTSDLISALSLRGGMTDKTNDFICYIDNSRNKRENINGYWKPRYDNKEQNFQHQLSYSNLYYLVLNKIIKKWKENKNSFHLNKCPCNNSFKDKNCVQFVFFLILYDVFIN